MNFKFTTKRTLIFLTGVLGGAAVSVLFGSNLAGTFVVFATTYYIAKFT